MGLYFFSGSLSHFRPHNVYWRKKYVGQWWKVANSEAFSHFLPFLFILVFMLMSSCMFKATLCRIVAWFLVLYDFHEKIENCFYGRKVFFEDIYVHNGGVYVHSTIMWEHWLTTSSSSWHVPTSNPYHFTYIYLI